jgi:hypothetical protein
VNQPPPPPGWYQDPTGPGLRWWDGAQWTEHQQHAAALPPPPTVPRPGLPTPPPGAPGYVPAIPQQKWWHIPLLVGLGVMSTVGYIVLQVLNH